MTQFDADVLFTGEALLRDASVILDIDGRVVAVGPRSAPPSNVRDRQQIQVLVPGFVNAHTHLTDAEIETPLQGDGTLVGWVRQLFASRTSRPVADGADRVANGAGQTVSITAVERVLRRMRERGTVAVGEVSNGMATLAPLRASGMRARFMYELLGFRSELAGEILDRGVGALASDVWSDDIQPALSIHAPYSVSIELARTILESNRSKRRITQIHMTEDPAERELYQRGTGSWRELLEDFGAWDPKWVPPEVAPIEHYDRQGLLGPDLAAVHLADATREEIALVARRGAQVVLSPSSNVHIGNRLPPLPEILRHDIRFALGTDGRGSNPSIDVVDEARLLLQSFDETDPLTLLRALTANGADALGLEELGRIAPGKRPGLVTVDIDRTDGSDGTVARRILLSDNRRPLPDLQSAVSA